MQNATDILVAMFERVGLQTNVSKTKAMTCYPGKIKTRRSYETYERTLAGVSKKEWDSRETTCSECGKVLKASSLDSHLESQHGIYRSRIIQRDLIIDREPVRFEVDEVFDRKEFRDEGKKLQCPVEGCSYRNARDPTTLRTHFGFRHQPDFICIPVRDRRSRNSAINFQDFDKCPLCDMQVNFNDKRVRVGHKESQACKEGQERKAQREAVIRSARALDTKFKAKDQELETVDVFEYLGRLLSNDDGDLRTVRKNLKKARWVWARLQNVLESEGADPRVCGMFYKAVVQSVLLYGCETWVVTPAILRMLSGFQIRAAWRMAIHNKPRKLNDDTWVYPRSDDVYKEVGLFSIEHYIQKRRNTLSEYAENRDIYKRCVESEAKRGTGPLKKYYWQQLPLEDPEFDLNAFLEVM